MIKIFNVLELIKKTNSTKEKEKILKQNESDELKRYLNILLNPFRVYYVNKFPTKKVGNKKAIIIPGKGFTKFENLVEQLEKRDVTGHIAINTIVDVFNTFTNQERKWFSKAITKKSIGVGITTVNKVYGNIIPKFKIMLADNEQPKFNDLIFPVIIQPKLDGFRSIYIPGRGLVGRNGKKIKNINLEKHFKTLFSVTDFVFDGELYSDTINFNKIASILNSENKKIPSHVSYYIFDGMEANEWRKQGCKLGYKNRMFSLMPALRKISNCKLKENITVLSQQQVNSVEEIKEKYEKYLKDGYEGAMLKDPNGLYQWKRVRCSTQIMMKIKPYFTEDCEVVDFKEGKGKYTNSLGKLIVNFHGVKVGVGSGFTNTERKDIWEHKERYRGTLAEVKGMEITPDKSIRHPIFCRFRPDKKAIEDKK